MEKTLDKMGDLELAEIQGSQYQEFMHIQSNLIAINGEIKRRKDLIKPVIEEVK